MSHNKTDHALEKNNQANDQMLTVTKVENQTNVENINKIVPTVIEFDKADKTSIKDDVDVKNSIQYANFSQRLLAYIINFGFARLLILPILVFVGLIGGGMTFLENLTNPENMPPSRMYADSQSVVYQYKNSDFGNYQNYANFVTKNYGTSPKNFISECPKPACPLVTYKKSNSTGQFIELRQIIGAFALILIYGLTMIGDILYGIFCAIFRIKTIGHNLLGLKVSTIKNNETTKPTVNTLILREIAKLIPFNLFISAITMLSSSQKTALHDTITQTVVIDEESK